MMKTNKAVLKSAKSKTFLGDIKTVNDFHHPFHITDHVSDFYFYIPLHLFRLFGIKSDITGFGTAKTSNFRAGRHGDMRQWRRSADRRGLDLVTSSCETPRFVFGVGISFRLHHFLIIVAYFYIFFSMFFIGK